MADPNVTLHVPYVQTHHKNPYPAISPRRPELSQAGRTVLILGGSAGIGFAIARAFIQASASHVIITGRRQGVLDEAVSQLKQIVGKENASTAVSSYVSDMASLQDTEQLWERLKGSGIVVDVLVLNAFSNGQPKPLLEADLGATWAAFETNVRGLLDHAQRFYKQGEGRQKVSSFPPYFPHDRVSGTVILSECLDQHIVNVSTVSIHDFIYGGSFVRTYSLTKNSGALLMQLIAKDTDAEDMQIVSFHPGAVLSESARNVGYTEASLDWDHGMRLPIATFLPFPHRWCTKHVRTEDLPGQFAVWCASKEARFLHGRFLPACWDVQELKTREASGRFESEDHFLRVGVVGLRS
jgi:NAD(P)-dependent dehydrogenase (short-subunit alcohol dehydrogenase family)